jgi:hypothetical protein
MRPVGVADGLLDVLDVLAESEVGVTVPEGVLVLVTVVPVAVNFTVERTLQKPYSDWLALLSVAPSLGL